MLQAACIMELKMKKYLKYLVLVLAMVSVLCSCGGDKLKSLSVPDVVDGFKELGIYDSDNANISAMVQGGQQINGITTNNWTYSFRDFEADGEACEKMFSGYLELVIDEIGSDTEGSNYRIVEGTGDGDYVLISRVDNTILLFWALSSEKEDIKAFAKDLGYLK